jgi:hypothetical protein
MIFQRKKVSRDALSFMEALVSCPSQMRRDLVFRDNCIENSYQDSILSHQQLFLGFYLFSLLLLSLGLLLSSILRGHLPTESLWICLSFIALILLGLGLTILDKQPKKYFDLTVLIAQILGCIGYLEIYFKISSESTSSNPIWNVFPMEVMIYLSLLSRCSWRVNLVSSLLLSLYLGIRIGCSERGFEEEDHTLPLYYLFINPVIVGLGAFFRERFERKLFFQFEQNRSSLICYQNLIKKILPSAILVFRDDEFVFINQEARRLLKIATSDKIEAQVAKIRIKSSKNEIPCFIAKKPSTNFRETNEAIELNFLDFLKSYDEINECGFKSFAASMPESYEPTGPELKEIMLEIKLGTITWENKLALIIIISQDFASEHINKLTMQSNYKDKLLATVSHDLRTPLNGVIGILEICLESVTDYATRKK